MNRSIALSLITACTLAVGCATQPSTPVAVNVTSDTATSNFVKHFRDVTVSTIAEQVPNARPMTVSVKLDLAEQVQSTPGMALPQQVNDSRAVTPLANDPVNDRPQPTVPVYNSAFQNNTSLQVTSYRVVYTISDASGQVVDSDQLILDKGHLVDAASHASISTKNGLVGDTANFLAARVRTLSH